MTKHTEQGQADRPLRELVLASTSPFRRAQLEQLRVAFRAVDPQLDERPFKQAGHASRQLVCTIAEAKARAVAAQFPTAIIIAADQCATIDGDILGKPGSVERAQSQLRRLAGRSHELITGLCVLDATTGRLVTHVDKHVLTMRALTQEQIRRYVEIDEPLGCAGAYKIESVGIALFSRVEGSDPSAIVGMPLMRLAAILQELGVDVLT
jgi:MAF protein